MRERSPPTSPGFCSLALPKGGPRAGGEGLTIHRQVPEGLPSARIFGTFRRWPLVPSAELDRLRDALANCVELVGSEAADELLGLITKELKQRSAEEQPDARRHLGPAGPTQQSAERRSSHGQTCRSRGSRRDQSGPAAGPARASRNRADGN